PRIDAAAVGGRIRRGTDLRVGGKGDRKVVIGIGILLPALGLHRTGADKHREEEGDHRAHRWLRLGRVEGSIAISPIGWNLTRRWRMHYRFIIRHSASTQL